MSLFSQYDEDEHFHGGILFREVVIFRYYGTGEYLGFDWGDVSYRKKDLFTMEDLKGKIFVDPRMMKGRYLVFEKNGDVLVSNFDTRDLDIHQEIIVCKLWEEGTLPIADCFKVAVL